MTAIACLRILVAGTAEAGRSIPVSQVEAAADLYLKHRWKHPRRYGAVAPLAFVLADSRAESLDPVEMQTLAVELEAGLFPGREAGQVCLLTFEGEKDDICAVGQTSAAHDLCSGIRPYRKRHNMQAGVGHYGVFNGSRYRAEIAPRILDFMRTHSAANRKAAAAKTKSPVRKVIQGGKTS